MATCLPLTLTLDASHLDLSRSRGRDYPAGSVLEVAIMVGGDGIEPPTLSV